jgi:hypothetical protein
MCNGRCCLDGRGPWLRVQLVSRGAGWDIAVVVDGTYYDAGDAEAMADWWSEQIAETLGDEFTPTVLTGAA